MWETYLQPTSLGEALRLLQQYAGAARVVAGGTDVLVELSRGVKPTATLIDITRLAELKYVRRVDGMIQLGALATHNDVVASGACVRHGLPLAQACWEVGAPPIRTRATIAGNLITASPANDTITPLMALDAELLLTSVAGERVVPLREFYTGFRTTLLRPDELLREIRFPALQDNQRGVFLKLGLRRAQAISVIDLAIVITFADSETRIESQEPAELDLVLGSRFSVLPIVEARITLGCLAPTIIHAPAAEAFLKGKTLDPATCAEAGRLAAADAQPIGDVRGSAGYRSATLANLLAEGLARIAAGHERVGWPERPVLLETAGGRPGDQETGDGRRESRNREIRGEMIVASDSRAQSVVLRPPSTIDTIETLINGQPYRLGGEAPTKSLLDALREDAGLTGTKEGCAEGECGACTVWLGGQAVMACLTPAGQAHGAAVTTIEGLAGSQEPGARSQEPGARSQEPGARTQHSKLKTGLDSGSDSLHPLQAAFIRHAAVQCGYCIPGMLMAGAKLLDECDQPDIEQAQVALSGNICRCTGYRKILDAVLDAAAEKPEARSQKSE